MISAKHLAYLLMTALLALSAYPESGHAEAPVSRPRVIVNPRSMIRGETITLGDIATISGTNAEGKIIAERLKGVTLGDAPAPRATRSFVGPQLLNLIESAGIRPQSIGYSIPNIVIVEREGRIVTQEEILEAVRNYVKQSGTDELIVKSIDLQNTYAVPVGATRFQIESLGKPAAGKLAVRVETLVDEQPSARFLVTARVDYWQEVPVLARSLDRGMLISPEDLQVVRVNLNDYPDDIIRGNDNPVGYRAKTRLTAGEVIRKNSIDIPPVISKGKRVILIYKSGGVSASATAIATEDGFSSGRIMVQNDTSRKLVRASVVDQETVEVTAE